MMFFLFQGATMDMMGIDIRLSIVDVMIIVEEAPRRDIMIIVVDIGRALMTEIVIKANFVILFILL